MYRNPEETAKELRASERMSDKRSKYGTGSAKAQAKRALGQIDPSLKRSKAPAVEQSPLDDINEYRIAMLENRQTMVDAVEQTFSEETEEPSVLVYEDGNSGFDEDDPSLKVSGSLPEFIKQFEGFHEEAYWDQKQWSIGFGTKASGKGATITKEQAEAELAKNVQKAKSAVLKVKEKYGYDWANNQVDALTSFAYNLGTGKLETLTDKGTRGDEEISEMLLEYNKAGGKKLPGLVKRRQAEARLFTQGYGEDDQ